jgi:lipopolysaccharide transport system ATP-binding protein
LAGLGVPELTDTGSEQRNGGPPVAISARQLSKAYRVYARPQDRLKQMLWPSRRRFFSEFWAVRGVDLDVYRGETVGVVGRNGSGKSTLLKMICGTLAMTTGSLEVAGRVSTVLALGTGFNPEFTGRENARLNATLLGLSDTQIRDRMDSIIAFADIGPFFDRAVKSYSSGMHSRLAFSVAIHTDPDILVVDETLAVGDEAFNRKCFSRIEEIKRGGGTILFASHSANLVVELCDRAILMDGGERLLTSEPKEVIARYHRLLYARPTEVAAIREETRRFDEGNEVDAGEPAPESATPGAAVGATAPARIGLHGRFDPKLRSESTVEYPAHGARIRNPQIVDRSRDVVNVLLAGRTYTYTYDVAFEEDAFEVRFGMMLRMVSGVELGGQSSHPPRRGIPYIEAGSVVHVRFSFQTLLQPGLYFLNAGVLGVRDGTQLYLHRMLDASVFRIDPERPGLVTGVVDLSTGEPASVEIERGAS